MGAQTEIEIEIEIETETETEIETEIETETETETEIGDEKIAKLKDYQCRLMNLFADKGPDERARISELDRELDEMKKSRVSPSPSEPVNESHSGEEITMVPNSMAVWRLTWIAH